MPGTIKASRYSTAPEQPVEYEATSPTAVVLFLLPTASDNAHTRARELLFGDGSAVRHLSELGSQ